MSESQEEALFRAFRSRPGLESLTDLLRGHQDHIYNICFQVLRHDHDAQDATQEVLLEVTRGIGRIEDARAFKTWLYRVSFHAALRTKRTRNRHTERIRRKVAMDAAAGAPSEEERSAVIDALEHLDDESRCLVIEHYFERATLEDLGQRRGVTSVAIWKRIERAKEKLKRSLLAAGVATAPHEVSRALESVTPVSAPVGLVPDAIHSMSALLAEGGIAMGTKSTVSIGAIVTILICLSLGALMALFLGRRSGSGPQSAPSAALTPGDIRRGGSDGPAEASTVNTLPPEKKEPSAPESPLRAWLAEYRKRLDQEFPDRVATAARWRAGNKSALEEVRRLVKWREKELEGKKELMLSDPAALLEYLQSMSTGDYLESVLYPTIAHDKARIEFAELPELLVNGMRGLLRAGTREQKLEILSFLGFVGGQTDEFKETCRVLMREPDTQVQQHAVWVFGTSKEPLTEAEITSLRELASDSAYPEAAAEALSVLGLKKAPGYNELALELLESTGSAHVAREAFFSLTFPGGKKLNIDQRLIDSIGRMFTLKLDENAFNAAVRFLMATPMLKILPALDQAAANAPTQEWADAMKAVTEKLRSGATNSLNLLKLLPKE